MGSNCVQTAFLPSEYVFEGIENGIMQAEQQPEHLKQEVVVVVVVVVAAAFAVAVADVVHVAGAASAALEVQDYSFALGAIC